MTTPTPAPDGAEAAAPATGPALGWSFDMSTAPRDRDTLILTRPGRTACVGRWVQSIETGDIAWHIADLGEECIIVSDALCWRELPPLPVEALS